MFKLNHKIISSMIIVMVLILFCSGVRAEEDDGSITEVKNNIESKGKVYLNMSYNGGGYYQVDLLSPPDLQSVKLAGWSNLGITCTGFGNLQGIGDYNPEHLSIGKFHSISYTDTQGSRNVANRELPLFSFTCNEKPEFKLGSTAAIIYVGNQSITGSDINVIDLH